MKSTILVIIALTLCSSIHSFAQDGVLIDYTGNTRDDAAVLDVRSADQGMMVPRVELDATDSPEPISSNAVDVPISLLVFNAEPAGSGATAVTRGYYYWTGSEWARLLGSADTQIDDDWVTVGNDIERQSGDVYIGDISTTGNDLYISGNIVDWNAPDHTINPGGFNKFNEVELDVGALNDVSLYFEGDDNTGLFHPDDDEIGFINNGAESMYLDANGNLRIGATNATNNDIYISDEIIDWDNTSYFINPAGANRINEIEFDDGDEDDVSIYFDGDGNSGLFQPNNNEVGISTAGNERLRIRENGQVRVMDLAGSGDKLVYADNDGDLIATSPSIDPAAMVDGAGTTDYLARWTPDGNSLGVGVTQDDGSNVGIGTAPITDVKLNVDGRIGMNDNDIRLRAPSDVNHVLGYRSSFASVSMNGPLLMGRANGALGTNFGGDRIALFWNSDGNVGVGTTDPEATLDVREDVGGGQLDAIQLYNDDPNGDINSSWRTAINFKMTDGNTNNPANPQAQIAMRPGVGLNGYPEEASGALVFSTALGTGQNANSLNEVMILDQNGDLRLTSLAGSGNRIVIADGDGDLFATSPAINTSAMIDGSGTANQIAYWSDANTLTGSNNFTYNGTNATLTGGNLIFPSNTSEIQFNGGTGPHGITFVNDEARLYYRTSPNNVLIEDGSGNAILTVDIDDQQVGIGNTEPNMPLTIEPSGVDLIQFRDSGAENEWHIRTQGTGNANLGFTETGVSDNRLVLEAGGNVGINTNNPASTLHVDGEIRHDGFMRNQGATYSSVWMQFDEHNFGNSLILGGGGLTALGAGESASNVRSNVPPEEENLYLVSDGEVRFRTDMQNNSWPGVDAVVVENNGNLEARQGLYTRKRYTYYTTTGIDPGTGVEFSASIGAHDFCASGGFSSDIDEDDGDQSTDNKCYVFFTNLGTGGINDSHDNGSAEVQAGGTVVVNSTAANYDYGSKPNWRIQVRAAGSKSRNDLTCQAVCIDFDY